MNSTNKFVSLLMLAVSVLLTGCDTLSFQKTLPSDPDDSFRWPGMSELPWSDWTVASSYPKVSYRIRVHPNYSSGNYRSGHLARIEVRNEDSTLAEVTWSLSAHNSGDYNLSWKLKSTGESPPDVKQSFERVFLLEGNQTAFRSAIVSRTNQFVELKITTGAPKGWVSFDHRNMSDIFFKSETSETEEYVIVRDDPSKSGTGYETKVTFWNRRADPVVIEFVITEPGVERMPDFQRHVGGGSVTLLGGQTKSVWRSVPFRKWSIWTTSKASVLE